MTTELFTIDEFLTARLTADSTLNALGVYVDEVPPNVSYPLVFARYNSGVNRAVIGDDITHLNAVYVVTVVHEIASGRVSWQPLQDAATRIKTQLHQATLQATSSGGTIWRCSFEEPVRLMYTNNGVRYREQGGLYRVLAKAV